MRTFAMWIVLVMAATLASIGAVAHAASGPFQSSSLTSSATAVSSCDPTGTWSYSFTKDANGRVDSVLVSSIGAACSGGRLTVTLSGPTSAVSSTAVIVSSCSATCSATVSFGGSGPFPADATSARSVIAGP